MKNDNGPRTVPWGKPLNNFFLFSLSSLTILQIVFYFQGKI